MTRTARRRATAVSAQPPIWQLSAHGRFRRLLLSAICSLWGGGAYAAPFGSPGYFAQLPATGGKPSTTTGSVPSATVPGSVTTAQQAQLLSRRSVEDFARAAEAIAAAQAAQTAAHTAAQQLTIDNTRQVPDGLSPRGLNPTAQAALDVASPATCSVTNTCTWLNAELPTQAQNANGTVTVTVQQTGQKAILTWDSFNVGKNTTLHFDQTAGTQLDGSNNWIALNRITAEDLSPSQILGSIQAEGSVYLINPYGIIFGGSSQVNVHTLIASSLSLFSTDVATSNKTFLEQGIDGVLPGNNTLLTGFAATATAAEQLIVPGDVRVESGGQITTGKLGLSLLAAPNVQNEGHIVATDGQVILAAGTQIGRDSDPTSAAPVSSFNFKLKNISKVSDGTEDATPRSSVLNTGLIESKRGSVNLIGLDIEQDGVVAASVSLTRPGSITMRAFDEDITGDISRGGSLLLGASSVTALLPEEDGETTTSSDDATKNFLQSTLSLSGIKLSGGAVRLEGNPSTQSGALIEAPGQTVSVSADAGSSNGLGMQDHSVFGRVYIDNGAVIDVAGLADVQLAMSANLITIPRVGLNELADSPLQRDGVLYGSSVTVDARNTGTRSDGTNWIGTPLANLSGYVDQVSRGIDQMLQNGGTIKLAGNEVITQKGSFLNVDAGYVHYLGGVIATTQLLTSQGQVVDIAKADPSIQYSGIAGLFTEDHPRWNITFTYSNPLLKQSGKYESEYVQSGNGGTLQVYGLTSTLLAGDISAQAFAGRHQLADGKMPTSGSFYFGSGNSLGSLANSNSAILNPSISVLLRDTEVDLQKIDANFNFSTPLSTAALSITDTSNILHWTPISSRKLQEAGFSNVTLQADDPAKAGEGGGEVLVANGSSLTVRPGGSINLTGSRVTVLGNLTAQSGEINVTGTGNTDVAGSTVLAQSQSAGAGLAGGDVVIGSGVTLSTRGQWVNDAGLDVDQQSGAAYVNGGSITLQTLLTGKKNPSTGCAGLPADCIADTTGSIILGQGSKLDVSSGGYVLPSGEMLMSNGVVQGKGGDIALLSAVFDPARNTSLSAQNAPRAARIVLGGSLLGYGFSGGGTLSLRAPGIQIGDATDATPGWMLTLPADFFQNQGFGAYKLYANFDAGVVDGTQIIVTQSSLLPEYGALLSAPTGTDLYAVDSEHPAGIYTSIGRLDDYHRQATNWSLYAGDYRSWISGGIAPDYASQGMTGTLTVGSDALVKADAGAALTLGSASQLTVEGSLVAHGGSITLTGDTAKGGYEANPLTGSEAYSSTSKSIWLGANSLLDVSGTVLLNPLAAPVSAGGRTFVPRTGKLLDGGTVTLSNDTGYIVALGSDGDAPGARIDVSGGSAVFDLPSSDSSTYAAQTLASNAGTIRLGVGGGLSFNAVLSAHGGGTQAAGGTLVVAPESTAALKPSNGFAGANSLLISNGVSTLSASGLTPGQVLEEGAVPSGVIQFGTGVLANSGIENLRLGTDLQIAANGQTALPVSFAPNTSLALGRSIEINASQLVGIADDSGNSLVQLAAPYISLHGYVPGGFHTALPALNLPLPGVSLAVSAQQIDLGGQFALQNFGSASFNAAGDLRFLTPAQYGYVVPTDSAAVAVPGLLYAAGNLDFTAAQLYPASGSTFIIDAVGTLLDKLTGARAPTTVSFHANANSASSQTPLSAGGALLVDATTITQNGYLRAPSGQILLGVSNVSDSAIRALFSFNSGDSEIGSIQLPLTQTASVQLGAGSLTSVSLDGLTVPYGATVDGINWTYDGYAATAAASGTALPAPANLTTPPEKNISLSGASVAVDAGATVDLSGGGDLQAQEWVPGTGGSHDVLAASTVYAIIPGYQGPAAYDPAIVSSSPLVGKAVYLTGIAGLPAGVYTLLPGKYATLPGAYRIVQDAKAIDTQTSQNRTLPDGSLYVAGYFTDLLSGARDARSTAFKVQSASVWQQYSEYILTGANSYFAALAKSSGTVTPRLPMDAGHLALAATGTLSLGATLNTSTPQGGVGAQVDIASSKLQITGDNSTALDGYVQISASELDQLNASSLLIGGTRTRNEDGDLLTAVASSVVLDNGSQTLYAPEIMLLSAAGADAGSGVNLTANSSIEARGSIAAGADVPIIIGKTGTVKTAVSGDGALLRVSNGAAVPIERINVPGSDGVAGTPNGLLSIAAGASVKAGTSVTLDSSGKTQVDPAAQISAKQIDADAQLITLSNDDTTQADGLVVGPQLLALFSQADRISLGSRSAINFIGDFTLKLDQELALSAGSFTGNGNVSLAASSLTISNGLNAATPASVAGTGTLTLTADQLYFGAGDKSQSGFVAVNASANKTITVQGEGSFDFGAADLNMNTPRLLADSGANNSLHTSGAMTVTGRAGSDASDVAPLGGRLSLAAATLSIDTWVQAASGGLKLEAASGDLTLGSKAFLDARGSSKTIYDVEEYADAGTITLSADQGKLSLAEGSVVDVSAAPAGGDAGQLVLSAAAQTVELGGALKAQAGIGGRGGSFSLDVGQSINLDNLAAQLGNAGFDQAVAIRARSGDLNLSAGHQLSAESISLTADGADSHLSIAGTLDASGDSGGGISLFGRGQLQVLGSLLARATAAGQSGGKIALGTSGSSNSSDGVNADFGYENVLATNAGFITIGPGAILDVSGSGGNGKVSIRAPLLSDGSVPVSIDPTARIINATEVGLEAYATWSTGDAYDPTDALSSSKHFDGIVDPAGWFDASGQLLPGTFIDYLGKKVAVGSLETNYFTPTQPNLAHRDFYQTTLLNFVQLDRSTLEMPFAGVANFKLRPGIELANPAAADVNGGNIAVLSNWNLGAGNKDANGNLQLAYRYHGSIAPVLSLRAVGDIAFQASISDGFFQYSNPLGMNFAPFTTGQTDNSASPLVTAANPLPLLSANLDGTTVAPDGTLGTADSTSYRIVAGADTQSADPLALGAGGHGSVTLDGHTTAYKAKSARAYAPILAPTMIRSGVGSIDIAAAQDVQLLDTDAPGVIYTGGVPAQGTSAAVTTVLLTPASAASQFPYILNTGTVNPDSAGDITIRAGGDITGVQRIIDVDGSRTGRANNDISQYWWPWMQCSSAIFKGCTPLSSGASVNFGAFDQGILSVGGNVRLSAGGDVRDLSVSLPSTWYLSDNGGTAVINVVGGGNLDVLASGNVLSGAYFVARGTGRIRAGGRIAEDAAVGLGFGTLLALQDAQLSLSAAGDVTISGIFNPSYLYQNFDSQSYGAASSVSLSSAFGEVTLGGNSAPDLRFGVGRGSLISAYSYVLPARLDVVALNGGINILRGGELYPSEIGQISLIADGDIVLSGEGGRSTFGLIDAAPTALPSPLSPIGSGPTFRSSFINYVAASDAPLLHAVESLHEEDAEPVRLYSLEGDIVDGRVSGNSNLSRMILSVDKPALIRAGRDIVNLSFSGQNLYASDVTLIAAGRDIYNTSLAISNGAVPFIQMSGVGTLLLSAGRNIGPLTSANELLSTGIDPNLANPPTLYGITTIGNSLNPYLPTQGADILSAFGVAPGVATQAFADAYIDPAAGVTGVPHYDRQLIAFVQSYLTDQAARTGQAATGQALTAAEAWTVFQTLPEYQQQRLAYAVLFDVLNRTGLDYNDPSSLYAQQYARGYAAINTLFPASLGYSENDLSGASNGAKAPVFTGNFDMRGSTVQTRQGGDISLLGPGGNVLVGSTSAPAGMSNDVGTITPNNQGILTLETGSINLFTDRSVLLAQSRIFTEQGGDVLIWSSNGDINAGKGAKTSSAIPPPEYLCNPDHYCTVDAKSQVSGAGIASLQTDAASGKQGNANLIAPAGTVDAGEAGIRVAGNINVAALRVANAGNIQVQGKTSGVPTSFVDVGALGAANAIGAAIDKTVAQLASERPEEQDAETMITVEVLGFGEPDEEQRKKLRR